MCRKAPSRIPRHTRRRPRSGLSSVLLLLLLGTLLALTALVLDLARLSHQHLEMEVTAEAAALAGAVELMDPMPLGSRRHAIGVGFSGSASHGHLVSERVARAKEQALAFAARNVSVPGPLVLDANGKNAADGDVVAGWVEEPTRLGCELTVRTGKGPVNSLLVRAERSHNRHLPMTLWFGQLVGLHHADLVATVRATVDQRVYGFRPVGHVRVPLVPILVSTELGRRVWPLAVPVSTVDSAGDRFAVDERTAHVRLASDGIPEVILRIGPCSAPSDSPVPGDGIAARLLVLNGSQMNRGAVHNQIVHGLAPDDLALLGGQFTLSAGGVLRLPTGSLDDDVDGLRRALMAIRGQSRIWPLGALIAGSNEGGCCDVFDFAAGCVVDCRREADSCLLVVVQPSLRQTCTAMVGPGRRNPWIGKLMLSR